MYYKVLLNLLIALIVFSCANNSKNKKNTITYKSPINIKYANGFNVIQKGNYMVLEIKNPKNKNSSSKFVLGKQNKNIATEDKAYPFIKVPAEKIICMTSTQLPYLTKLGLINNIVGISSSKYIFNKEINKAVESGKIKRIGFGGNFKVEEIINLDPNFIFVSPFKAGGYASLKDIGINLVPNSAYMETLPLARAEWIKLMGLLFDKNQLADSLFNKIEKSYLETKELTKHIKNKPTVFSGELKSGIWYGVGGKSYVAQYFYDAGACYLWEKNNESGGLKLDFETVYNKAENSDFWRVVTPGNVDFNYSNLLNRDKRYSDFKAFKNKKVIFCNLRTKPFYELSPVEPDVVLKDLIKIFHPTLLPNHQPKYYTLLK